MMVGENRKAEAIQKNPAGGLPFLELDNGVVIAETVAICRMMEDVARRGGLSTPTLMGNDWCERAQVEMWLRRVEQHIVLPICNGFRWGVGKGIFAGRGMHGMLANDKAAAMQIQVAESQLKWLDDLMIKAGSPEYICLNRFSICDIMLYVFIYFFDKIIAKINDGWFTKLQWVPAWYNRIAKRPASIAAKDFLKPKSKM